MSAILILLVGVGAWLLISSKAASKRALPSGFGGTLKTVGSALANAESLGQAVGQARLAFDARPLNWIQAGARVGGDICPILGNVIGAMVGGLAGVFEQIFGGRYQPRRDSELWKYCRDHLTQFGVTSTDDRTVSYCYYLVCLAALKMDCYVNPVTGAIAFQRYPRFPEPSLNTAEKIAYESYGQTLVAWVRQNGFGGQRFSKWLTLQGQPAVGGVLPAGGTCLDFYATGKTRGIATQYEQEFELVLPEPGVRFQIDPVDGHGQSEGDKARGVHWTYSLQVTRIPNEDWVNWQGPMRLSQYEDAFLVHAEYARQKIGALLDG